MLGSGRARFESQFCCNSCSLAFLILKMEKLFFTIRLICIMGPQETLPPSCTLFPNLLFSILLDNSTLLSLKSRGIYVRHRMYQNWEDCLSSSLSVLNSGAQEPGNMK